MSKNKQLRAKISNFLGSYRGKTIFNFFYGFGASLAILGTMFKLLHLDYANVMLAIGLGTEVFIFALSSFEPPYRNYHWDQVFPVLKTHDENDRPDFSGTGIGGTVIVGNVNGMSGAPATGQQVGETGLVASQAAAAQPGYKGNINPVSGVTPEQARMNYGISPQVPLTEEESQTLADSIKRMGEAVNQLNNLADVSVITEKYLSQLSGMADNLNRFSDATGSLAEVSNVLLDSYRNITENSDDISNNSKGYVEQMGNLNRNLMGLNTIYEIQLKSISSQIDTIDRVNKGLVHIKDMYEGSMGDSDRFNKETENLAENLSKLNTIYSRMLEAMTPNIIFGGFNPGKGSETPKES
ncbi:MAG: gliding motility protein GldL [Bacteroidales bacterium]|nr:gliding motility protein GldL [Bacteroidales bacterium]